MGGGAAKVSSSADYGDRVLVWPFLVLIYSEKDR